jgi:hypothetical protein
VTEPPRTPSAELRAQGVETRPIDEAQGAILDRIRLVLAEDGQVSIETCVISRLAARIARECRTALGTLYATGYQRGRNWDATAEQHDAVTQKLRP